MSLSILVPFRDADGTRTRAKEWILRRWHHFWPKAEIIEASDDGVDPFNKSMAVNKAARKATGDVFAILDADTWIDPSWMSLSLQALEQGWPWVRPAMHSYRLRQDVSEEILRTDPIGPFPRIGTRMAEQVGAVVGFLWLVPREGFEQLGGMDERFRGWGGEDIAFVWAATKILGQPKRLPGSVASLWHARPREGKQRVWVGQDISQEQEKAALAARYRSAHSRAAMLEVLAR